MNTVGKAALRFLITFCSTILIASGILVLGSVLDTGTQNLTPRILQALILSIPLAIVSAVFITFFLLNRIVGSRLIGYILIVLLSGVTMLGMALLIRLGIVAPHDSLLATMPSLYRPIGTWMLDIALAPWPIFVAGIASFSFFVAGFWGVTRVSRNRPLLGAFIAPNAALLSVYLFGLYLSGPADAIFVILDIEVPRLISTAILTAISALALVLLDALLARKPSGVSRNA